MNIAYYLRMLNAVLGGLVVGICFVKTGWDYTNRARNARVGGLALLCIAITWLSIVRRSEPFKPWLPVITIGLLLCFYGMRRQAAGEKRRT